MIRELFTRQKRHLDEFFEAINIERCEQLVEMIMGCEGVLFFTGVGKSGYIAQKIAATIMSTGTKAFFLSPIDALHGDLGLVTKKDILLLFSKSGETEELVQLLPFVRNKGTQICAITSNHQSQLAKAASFSLVLPCEHELCPFDLAPTISTEIQLLFGDVLAIALMHAKQFPIDDYAANHPAGRIGRRASIKVSDLMLTSEKTPLCDLEARLEEVLVDFTDKRCGCLLVMDENKRLQGIFTDGDLRRALQKKGEHVLKEKVSDLMTRSPKTIVEGAMAWDAMKIMEADQQHPVMVLPVLNEEEQVIGIIKMHDLIQANL